MGQSTSRLLIFFRFGYPLSQLQCASERMRFLVFRQLAARHQLSRYTNEDDQELTVTDIHNESF
jgi:hypothetical protein